MQQKSDNLINTKSHNKREIDEMSRKEYHILSHLLAFMIIRGQHDTSGSLSMSDFMLQLKQELK